MIAAYKYLRPKLAATCAKADKNNAYESEKLLNEYLGFHYGGPAINCLHVDPPKNCFDFPLRCAELCMKHFDPEICSNERSLDIGCAVGRSTFELARVFRESLGIDFSFGFIKTCEVLSSSGKMRYEVTLEGDLTTSHVATVSEDIDKSRCLFRQGDACNLPLDIGQFGCVLAANLICRLPDPKSFFLRLKNLVAPGGICVITSPYTFMQEYTKKSNWIGGYNNANGEEVRAFEQMKIMLSRDFELVERRDMSFLIRETARKHQWTVADTSVWRRVGY